MMLTISRGETIGKVIVQKASHFEQPSTSAASYRLRGTFCRPERKTTIWMPLAITMSYTSSIREKTMSSTSLPMPVSLRIFISDSDSVNGEDSAIICCIPAIRVLSVSKPMRTPLERITGRKKIARTNARPLNS